MESKIAIDAFQALAQDTRLAALRLLVQAGPNGLPAGLIADRLAVQPSTLSTHLGILERAGLVESRRRQRHIFYAARYEGLRALIAFLLEDCCQGRPEICGADLLALAGKEPCGPDCAPPAAAQAVPSAASKRKKARAVT